MTRDSWFLDSPVLNLTTITDKTSEVKIPLESSLVPITGRADGFQDHLTATDQEWHHTNQLRQTRHPFAIPENQGPLQ